MKAVRFTRSKNPPADHPAIESAKRRRAALEKLKRQDPHPVTAPLLGDRYTVLVHKSTKKAGWWQATFFDAKGMPYSDAESKDWRQLLEHIHGDSVDWTRARRPNPRAHRLAVTKAETASMRWSAHREMMRQSKKREAAAKSKRKADLGATSKRCEKRRRRRIVMCKSERDNIRRIARESIERERAFRKDAREAYSEESGKRKRLGRGKRRYSRAESDSLAIHNIPEHLVALFGEVAHNFPVSLQPDHRAELFLEWVEAHPEAVAETQADRYELADDEYARAYAEYAEAS